MPMSTQGYLATDFDLRRTGVVLIDHQADTADGSER
jgi:hypothetical protein